MGRIFSTNPTIKCSEAKTALPLHTALKAQLLDLPFTAFAQCVCDLLYSEGYTQVRLAGRASYRGRNKEGGFDIEAFLPSPLSQKQATGNGVLRRKVIVQVKQFPNHTKVYQRTLDELRGACLRVGAIEAVLITTSDFSPLVRNSESALRREAGSGNLAPVHLMSGEALVERLTLHRIGVHVEAGGGLALDRDYFARLRAEAPKDAVKAVADATSSQAVFSSDPKKRFTQGLLRAQMSRTQTEITLTLPITLFDTLAGHGTKGGV